MIRSTSLFALLFLSVLVNGLTAHDDQHPVPIEGPGAAAPPEPSPLQAIAVSPDGLRTYLSSADGKKLLAVDSATGAVLQSADLTLAVSSVEITADGSRMAVFFEDGNQVSLYQASSLSLLGVVSTGTGARNGRFSADGSKLYVACSESHTLSSYSTTTLNLLAQSLFAEEPTDVVPVGDGSRLAVAFEDGVQVLLVAEDSLTGTATLSVPPGSSYVGWLPLDAGQGLLLVSSTVTDTISLADVSTRTVLKTVMVGRPGRIAISDALQRQAFVGRAGAKVEALDGDPASPDFGRRLSTLFMAAGNGGFGLARGEGSLVVASDDRTNVVRVRRDQLATPPRVTVAQPSAGMPGTSLVLQGSFGAATDISVVFTEKEAPNAVVTPALALSDRLELILPSEVPAGAMQIWISLASPAAVRSGTYLAHSPVDFRVLGLTDGLDAFIAELGTRPGAAAALDYYKKAKRLIEDGGEYKDIMKALADGYRTLKASPDLASLLPTAVRLVRTSALTKIVAVEKRLGGGNPDVVDARNAFQDGDRLMASGDLDGAVDAYLRSYVELRDVLPLALALTGDQRHVVIREALGDIHRLDGTLYSRVVSHHNHSSEEAEDISAVEEIFPLISGRPNNTFKGSAEGDMVGGATRSTFAKIRKALNIAAQKGLEPADLEAMIAAGIGRLIGRVADAMEANGGAPEPSATALRKRAAAAGGGYDGLAEVAGDLEPMMAAPAQRMAMAMAMEMTEPECDPTLTLRVPDTVCLHPDAPAPKGQTGPGNIEPQPLMIKATGNGIPMELGGKGVLLLTIVAYDGATLVYSFQAMDLENGVEKDIPWDGYGDDGKIVKLKGDSKTGKFKAVGRFICPDDTKFVDDHADFTIVQEGGLIVKPPDLSLCESSRDFETRFQYKAYRCQNGGLQEVTTKCIWSLSDRRLGKIGANSGLFIATSRIPNKRALTGKVVAVHIPTKERGEATVTVSSRQGSLTPGGAFACPLNVIDFDVHASCDADGMATLVNDKDYDWKVTPRGLGTINDTGIFVALKKGPAKITATPKKNGDPGPFSATVDIGGVDEVDIIQQPLLLRVGGPSETFRVQVFCHNQKVANKRVDFKTDGEPQEAASISPDFANTDAEGRAETQVSPRRASREVNSSAVEAIVEKIEEAAWFTVVDLDLQIRNGLEGRSGGQVVSEADEETVGAITVANLNDTDGNGVADNLQVGGVPGEVDLMRLDIRGPKPNLGGIAKLIVTGPMNLWRESTKTTNVMTGAGTLEFEAGSVPPLLWAECTATSAALRDYSITLSYEALGMQDRVTATALWVNNSRVFVTRQADPPGGANNPHPGVAAGLPDLDEPTLITLIDSVHAHDGSLYGEGTFIEDIVGGVAQDTVVGGRILFEFEILPHGVEAIPGVIFDCTRQVSRRYRTIASGTAVLAPVAARPDRTFSAIDEERSDDAGGDDEDNRPTNHHIYVFDGPSIPVDAGAGEAFYGRLLGFREFVRVAFSGALPNVNSTTPRGGRCSNKVGWISLSYLRRNAAGQRIFDVADPSASDPIMNGPGTGTATATATAAAGAATEGFNATFAPAPPGTPAPANGTWTLTGTSGATTTVAGVVGPGGVTTWTLTLGGRSNLVITRPAGAPNFGPASRMSYSVFHSTQPKQNVIQLGTVDVTRDP